MHYRLDFLFFFATVIIVICVDGRSKCYTVRLVYGGAYEKMGCYTFECNCDTHANQLS